MENLQNQGVTCFYPNIMVERVSSGRRVKKLEPLFPGYVFVNIEKADPAWAKLRSTRGVLRVVSFANKPAAIQDGVITYLKETLHAVSERGGIKPGQVVELGNGAFKGIDAIFQAYDGEERAIVLITFMQKQQNLTVPLSAIKP